MKRHTCAAFLFTICIAFNGSIGHAQTARSEIIVSAAASMKDALTEINGRYQQAQPGTVVRTNFASSGTLQRQIEQGAPVDVFIAAADKNMDELARQKLIEPGTRRVVARNRLVLIVPANVRSTVQDFGDLSSSAIRRVAIGAPASVPAGQYAQQVLTKLHLWQLVLGKAIQCKDVREVLTQVKLGNVDAGIVYSTDAMTTSRVRVKATAAAHLHNPINYPAGVVAASQHKTEARSYAAFLAGPVAKAILKKYGFIVPSI